MKFLDDRGWNKIWDKGKHFMLSFFATICLYGIPYQWFNITGNPKLLLFGAAGITFIAGGIWEWVGNKDKWDLLADLCGVVLAIILIGVIWK